jgi:GIY-YIG catalytic domain
MADEETIPWAPLRPFDRDSILKHAPRDSGLYRLVDRQGVTAYIGISSNIQRRLIEHWDAKGRGNKHIRKLRIYAESVGGNIGFQFAYYVCARSDARALEGIRTTTSKPILNTREEWAQLWEDIVDFHGKVHRVRHQSGYFH